MDKTIIIIVAAALVATVAIVAAVWMYLQNKQTRRLQSKFGPEYERLAAAEGDRARTEKTLHEREKRVEEFNLVPLSAEDRDRFAGEWRLEQAGFVDDPASAVANADKLVTNVMTARGYPMATSSSRPLTSPWITRLSSRTIGSLTKSRSAAAPKKQARRI